MKTMFLLIIVILGVISVSARDQKCPIESKGNVIHLPHETDCTKFYMCDPVGNLIVVNCDPGTEYDPISKVCAWPNGNCKPNLNETIKTDQLPKGCNPNEDPEHPTHLPHPTRCDCFYKCNKGIPVLILCPPGLEWNIQRDYCDWPSEAHCVRPIVKTL